MYKYQVEKIKDILPELKGLIQDHWEEVAWYKDKIPLSPDYDRYLQMEELGMIHTVTVRYEDELIGYDINFVSPHLHYSSTKYAANDIIFLHPLHRGAGVALGMLNFAEEKLKEEGVSVITIHMKVDNPFKSLMDLAGFKHQEYIYSRYIGA